MLESILLFGSWDWGVEKKNTCIFLVSSQKQHAYIKILLKIYLKSFNYKIHKPSTK